MKVSAIKKKICKFKKESRNIIDFVLNNLDIFNLINSPVMGFEQSKSFKNLKIKIFQDLKDADTFAKKQFTKKLIERQVKEVKGEDCLPNINFASNSKYASLKSIKYIKKNAKGIVTYKVDHGKHKFTFSFLIFDSKFRNLNNFDIHAYKVIMWLYIVSLYGGDNCAETLNISLFFANEKKVLPDNGLDILSTENCNTAVTTSCTKDGIIFLYRDEEWFKVLIHESFHIFGLDFSYQFSHVLNKKMEKTFPIDSQWNIFESYTEFWAEILNVMFVSYLICDEKKSANFNTFSNYIDFFIEIEMAFTIFQVSKILDFMGLKLMDLHFKNKKAKVSQKYLYRENTNVFSYYILKMLLFLNLDESLIWFDKHNQNLLKFSNSRKDVEEFGDFLIKKFENPVMHRMFLAMDKKKMGISFKNKDEIINTLRMSAVELV